MVHFWPPDARISHIPPVYGHTTRVDPSVERRPRPGEIQTYLVPYGGSGAMPTADAEDEGFVVWMEGLPGSGKTTLSRASAAKIRELGWKAEVLDGDEVRHMFSPELGFSRQDREVHARRVSYVAHLLARNGVAVITPYETSRQAARSVEGRRFEEVWLRCPIEVCRQRDPQGMYRRAMQGSVKGVTGIDAPFEEPLNPDLIVDTSGVSIDECTERVVAHLRQKGFLARPPA
jgi:adenylylsulfate kinase